MKQPAEPYIHTYMDAIGIKHPLHFQLSLYQRVGLTLKCAVEAEAATSEKKESGRGREHEVVGLTSEGDIYICIYVYTTSLLNDNKIK